MVGNHCPASEGKGGEHRDAEDVDAEAHSQETECSHDITPHDHLVEMGDIVRSLL